MSADDERKQKFELYIKASAIDKETKGSCPICQHWFMITYLLGEIQDDIDFKVYTVQADCPPKNFGVDQGWSKKFPVVMVLSGYDKRGQDLAGTKYDTHEELELFFEAINKDSRHLKNKNALNQAAMEIAEGLYPAFNGFLSNERADMEERKKNMLIKQLQKINTFLTEEGEDHRFLVDDMLTYSDCFLLPRLHHVRVAGKAYRDFEIPQEFTALWKYLYEAYKTEAFRSTMPSDQDIVFQYEKKVPFALKKRKGKPNPTLQNFTYTLDIPDEVMAKLAATGGFNGDVSEQLTEEVSTVDISPQPEVLVEPQQVEPEYEAVPEQAAVPEQVAEPEPEQVAESEPEQVAEPEQVDEPEPEQVAEPEQEPERLAEPEDDARAEGDAVQDADLQQETVAADTYREVAVVEVNGSDADGGDVKVADANGEVAITDAADGGDTGKIVDGGLEVKEG